MAGPANSVVTSAYLPTDSNIMSLLPELGGRFANPLAPAQVTFRKSTSSPAPAAASLCRDRDNGLVTSSSNNIRLLKSCSQHFHFFTTPLFRCQRCRCLHCGTESLVSQKYGWMESGNKKKLKHQGIYKGRTVVLLYCLTSSSHYLHWLGASSSV
jgi:hypothetical protein